MILADKISELRKKNGWSQEELAEQLGVSRQSISKWESAQSMPDMNRILKMSEVFGVSTDMLLKDELALTDDRAPAEVPEETGGTARPVSMEEASEFLSFREFMSGRIALGVLLCILSPVLLIIMSVLPEAGVISLSETAASGIGLIVLFILVGIAVFLFVTTGLQSDQYDYIEKELLDTAYGVDGMVRERREKYRPSWSVQLVTGIVLCVMSAVPLFVAMLVFGDSGTALTIAMGILLVIVAIGVNRIVQCSIIWDGFQMLLQDGEYTPARKLENAKNEHLAAIYWGLAVAIFLAVSFLTNAWDRTWIVWPVAGVGYGVVTAIAAAARKR